MKAIRALNTIIFNQITFAFIVTSTSIHNTSTV